MGRWVITMKASLKNLFFLHCCLWFWGKNLFSDVDTGTCKIMLALFLAVKILVGLD